MINFMNSVVPKIKRTKWSSLSKKIQDTRDKNNCQHINTVIEVCCLACICWEPGYSLMTPLVGCSGGGGDGELITVYEHPTY